MTAAEEFVPELDTDTIDRRLEAAIAAGDDELADVCRMARIVATNRANVGPYGDWLNQVQDRPRLLGKFTAAHPMTLERVVADLDAEGPSEAGDAIQSLVFYHLIAEQRAQMACEDYLALRRQIEGCRSEIT